MSHKNTIKGQIKNKPFFMDVCRAMGINIRSGNTHKLYSDSNVEGLGIDLPGWNYPVVITEDGSVVFDNYNGSWGDIKRLHDVMDDYNYKTVEDASLAQGHTIHDTTTPERRALRIESGSEGAVDVEFIQGEVRVDAQDFSGTSCEEFTKYISEAIGGKEAIEYKDEYFHEKAAIKTQLREQGLDFDPDSICG